MFVTEFVISRSLSNINFALPGRFQFERCELIKKKTKEKFVFSLLLLNYSRARVRDQFSLLLFLRPTYFCKNNTTKQKKDPPL